MNSSEYVVVREDVIESQVFDRSAEFANGRWIASKFDLGVCDTNLHGSSFP